MKSFLLLLLIPLMLTSCGTSVQNTSTASGVNTSSVSGPKSTTLLVARAHTPTPGDTGDFFISTTIDEGSLTVGERVDIAEKSGRSITIVVKALRDSGGDLTTASKGQGVSIYFDGDTSIMAGISMDSYLVEKGGRYPLAPTQVTQAPETLLFVGKVNGAPWEGKSTFNPPPYYKYGSRAMMSPDTPIFKMSFENQNDRSAVSFDLIGELKVGKYSGKNLNINFSNASGTLSYDPSTSDVVVEVTAYTENGNAGIISGKVSGSIGSSSRGSITIEGAWKDAKIDVWGEEAK